MKDHKRIAVSKAIIHNNSNYKNKSIIYNNVVLEKIDNEIINILPLDREYANTEWHDITINLYKKENGKLIIKTITN